MADDDFEPRLGRQRAQGGKRARQYLGRVLAAANLARGGARLFGTSSSGFNGSRIGRGAGVGRVLAGRDRHAAYRQRRVVIKSRIVRLAGKGAGAAAAHLRYLQRDGTTREGAPGVLYGADADALDGKAFHERGAGDRHQIRFIVSAEDGAHYDDLKPLTRRLMARVEEDLGTELDWVAVDHFNTGHPHTHIIVRGKDDRGKDLIIARDYLTSGMRERAAELVDLDLGPRSIRDIETSLRAEVEQERLTSIDRALLDGIGDDRVVEANGRNAFDQSIRSGRLAKLSRLGLAEPLGAGRWRLAAGLDDTLKRMGERGDIVRTMQRDFTRARLDRAAADRVIYDPASAEARPLVGRVIARGLADEQADRHYLLVDATDGRSYYVAIGRGDHIEALGDRAIVRIEPLKPIVRAVDRTIAAVAAANNGRYDIDTHLRHDRSATESFAETHVRRLEAMRRAGTGVERRPDGSWVIAPDHLEQAAAYEKARVKDRPVAVQRLATQSLETLVSAEAATWLDHELLAADPHPLRDAGFGHDARIALDARRQWLIAQELAEGDGEATRYVPGLLAALQRREVLRVAAALSDELGLRFVEAEPGRRIEGVLRRPVEMTSGRFALIEKSREFTLVPWRSVLDRWIGRSVAGVARESGVSWTLGRGRPGPGIS